MEVTGESQRHSIWKERAVVAERMSEDAGQGARERDIKPSRLFPCVS